MITPQHRQAAERVAALLEARLAAKALPPPTPRPWSAFESRFYHLLRQILRGEALALALRAGQSGPSAVSDAGWWTLHEGALIDELTNSLGQIARYGAQAGRAALADGVPAGVNWGLVNRSAVDWAESHAGALVREIEPVTRAGLQQAVSEWAASGDSLPALAEKIRGMSTDMGTVFSPQRARMIAQTESTNAFAQGNVLAWQAAGVAPAAYSPAAHPNCRCYLQPLLLKDGTWVMKWFTAEDERVCTRTLNTPWGSVAGCAELHGKIVSHGPYLGQPADSHV